MEICTYNYIHMQFITRLSLVNGLVTKEICPATKSNSTADTSLNGSIEDTEVRSDLLKSELGNIFAIVMNLQHKVSSLENDVSSLKDENRDLTTLLNLLCDKERPVHTEGTSQTTPDTAISVPATHAPIVPVIRTGEESSSSSDSDSGDESSSSDNNGSFHLPLRYQKKLRRMEKKISALPSQTAKSGHRKTPTSNNPTNKSHLLRPARVPASEHKQQAEHKTPVNNNWRDLYI